MVMHLRPLHLADVNISGIGKYTMADRHHFEKSNNKYKIHFDEIWHGDASGTPTANKPLKFPKFENPKSKKSPYLLNRLTDFDEIWCGNALGPYAPVWVKKNLRY